MKIKTLFLLATFGVLSACQSLPQSTTAQPTLVTHTNFAITGKIGVTTQTQDGKQAGSAFYAWTQEGERFAIDLSGALGIGATSVQFDGKSATLTSEKTGTIQANTPEELLTKATGWQAPISQLKFWVVGQTAPNDQDSQWADNKLTQSRNGAWLADFEYPKNDARPNRLTLRHDDGHKVVMTIVYP